MARHDFSNSLSGRVGVFDTAFAMMRGASKQANPAGFACFDAPRIIANAVSKTPTRPERELEKSCLAINMFM